MKGSSRLPEGRIFSMSAPEIHTFKNDRFEMEYCFFGNGSRPFVIIPGISMKPIMLYAAGIMAGFQDFSSDWTVYVFDRKKSIQPGYSVWDMARDTADVMLSLGLSDCDIFGASQGGMIAQCIALNNPELVHALYLSSTMARANAGSRETLCAWLDLTKGSDVAALNHNINTKIYSPDFYAAYREVFAQMEADGTQQEAQRFRVLVQACLDFDSYDRLEGIKCPVFVVGSRADQVLTGSASEEIAEKLHCSIYMYDGYSHAVYDEAPDFRQHMKDALRSIR